MLIFRPWTKHLQNFKTIELKLWGVALKKYLPHCVYGQMDELTLIVSFDIKTIEEISLPWNYLLIIPL